MKRALRTISSRRTLAFAPRFAPVRHFGKEQRHQPGDQAGRKATELPPLTGDHSTQSAEDRPENRTEDPGRVPPCTDSEAGGTGGEVTDSKPLPTPMPPSYGGVPKQTGPPQQQKRFSPAPGRGASGEKKRSGAASSDQSTGATKPGSSGSSSGSTEDQPQSKPEGGSRPQLQQLQQQQSPQPSSPSSSSSMMSPFDMPLSLLGGRGGGGGDAFLRDFDRLARQITNLSIARLPSMLADMMDLQQHGTGMTMPSVDVQESKDKYTAIVPMPGVSPSEVRVEVDDDVLRVSAEAEKEETTQDEARTMIRRFYSGFSRALAIPDNVKADGIVAKMDNGVLRIEFPKVDEQAMPQKPRRIAVASDAQQQPTQQQHQQQQDRGDTKQAQA